MPKVVVLNYNEVNELMPMADCINVMAEALTSLARGQIHMPMRTIVHSPDAAGMMYLMPACRSGKQAAYGLKVLSVFPHNPALGKDAHQGSVLLLSAETGELLAVMNASAVTAIRTGAVSGVATKLLARRNASSLGIIGAGLQARTHLKAMAVVREIKHVKVCDCILERAERFALEMSRVYPFTIEAVSSNEEAVWNADIIITVTNSIEPVLKRDWISPGTHLNVVGSYFPYAREVDTATMLASKLYVDLRECTFNEAGDYILAAREGAIGPEHIQGEIGELLTGEATGRTSDEEITLFKALGLAVEDLATAEHVYRQAKARQAGTWVEF